MIKSGFVNILKPTNMTSFEVVAKVKKLFGTKKVGHLGTLDPEASGVLPVAVGNATKFFNYFLNKDKIYIARVKFGILTDTLDSFGQVSDTNDKIIKIEELLGIIPKFLGKISQIPPKYSAIKVNGKKAYELARNGEEFDLKSREIEIYKIDILDELNQNEFLFRVHCSAGTYIRSLFLDIAKNLDTIATTTAIIRQKSGLFNITNAVAIDDLNVNNLMPVTDVFSNIPRIKLSGELAKKLINGNFKAINSDEIESLNISQGEFFAYIEDNVIGLFEIKNSIISQVVYLFN